LAYRRARGASQNKFFILFALVTHALQKNQAELALQQLARISAQHIPEELRTLIIKLQAILHGDRCATLADDLNFSYTAVAELRLLIEQNPLPNT
jgi:hypothetical protein